jgi:uncharacterized RDD family membrane protein YckC
MQCPSCHVVYSNGLDVCPKCKKAAMVPPDVASKALDQALQIEPAPSASIAAEGPVTSVSMILEEPVGSSSAATMIEPPEQTAAIASSPAIPSTLIEFPRAGKANQPQWRKDLSERVREIQERKAREAQLEIEEARRRQLEEPQFVETQSPLVSDTIPPQLGLVPSPDATPINPLVAAALKRIEKARRPAQSAAPRTRSRGTGGAATAVARVTREQYQVEPKARPDAFYEVARLARVPPITRPVSDLAPKDLSAAPLEATRQAPEEKKAKGTAESSRERGLSVVRTRPVKPEIIDEQQVVEKKPEPRRAVAEVIDEALLARREAEAAKANCSRECLNFPAPVSRRVAAAFIDILIVGFASSPVAAVMELMNKDWNNIRVQATMGGIAVAIMFFYLTAATALAGRTWGMSSVSIRTVNSKTGLAPSTMQSFGRGLFYMVSLATGGLGLVYALFDSEGRTVHDRLSRTMVVRETIET